MKAIRTRVMALSALLPALCCAAQLPVAINVDLSKKQGSFPPLYSWFGYDESNYSTTKNGKALLRELHDLSPVPVYVRAHFLLASGDGKPELKWSSTNVYFEDMQGNPVYSWKILDQIFDAYAAAGVRPLVELGFMPKALSTHPDPYHIGWPLKPGEVEGWSYPPRNYQRWQELNRQIVAHMLARYGKKAVSTWYWEVWNEPDGFYYWKGTQDEYNKLYDFAVAGVRQALPDARVGGPATTGPEADGKASAYLRAFLKHVTEQKSAATGGAVPLDFISFHVKGKPNVVSGHVQMGLDHELLNASEGFKIVREFEGFRKVPILLTEADPEGCAACSARDYPPNAYRNGPLYPCYTAAAMKGLLDLRDRYDVNLEAMQTWAFEFEGRQYFEGFRTLATNGVDKPILNFFRMAGMLHGDRVETTSSGAKSLDAILTEGVRENADVDALSTSSGNEVAVMVWNYHDDDVPGAKAGVSLTVRGLPTAVHRIQLQHYRIDETHSNAFTTWKAMGSPQNPSAAQFAKLQRAGHLEMLSPARWETPRNGEVTLKFDLPRQGVSMIRMRWRGDASTARQ